VLFSSQLKPFGSGSNPVNRSTKDSINATRKGSPKNLTTKDFPSCIAAPLLKSYVCMSVSIKIVSKKMLKKHWKLGLHN